MDGLLCRLVELDRLDEVLLGGLGGVSTLVVLLAWLA
jgi:hypothetical protein